ncbi:hypothetical protein Btru_061951 [Bulinus truncatus]|nr:hypothetical protein Btru_061951 [Bulinus truncatus]
MQKHLRALSAGPKKTPKVYPKQKADRPATAVGNKQDSRQRVEEFLRRPHLKASALSILTAVENDGSPGLPYLDTDNISPVTMVQSIGLDLPSTEKQNQWVTQDTTVTESLEKNRPVKTSKHSTLLAWQTELKTDRDEDSIEEVELSDQVEPISFMTRHMGDTVVKLKHRCIATNGIKPLALALQTLDLTDNHIDSVGAEHLAQMLKENQTLVNLNLSNNRIGSKGLEAICDMLEVNTTLKVLSMADEIGGVECRELHGIGIRGSPADSVGPLYAGTHVDSWHCRQWRNHLNDTVGHLLINPLKNNSSLTSLDLSQNEFSITGAVCIGRALVVNESLIDLDLSWNSIRRQGAVAIANGIRVNKTLEMLDLSWNGFGIEGAVALQRSLSVNRTLKMLDLSNNRLNDDAVRKLSFGLKKNLTLETLSGIIISKRSHEVVKKLKAVNGKFILHGDIGSLNNEMVMESLGQWFQHFKTSRSGTLNDVIRQFDPRSKGEISTDEMKFCLRSAGFHLPKGYIDLLVQSLDCYHARLIKYRELLQSESQTNERNQFPLLMNAELEDIDGQS